MSKFQFPESIKSRPVYGTLKARPGKYHLMIADAEGAEAILHLHEQDAGLMAKPTLFISQKVAIWGALTGQSDLPILRRANLRGRRFANRTSTRGHSHGHSNISDRDRRPNGTSDARLHECRYTHTAIQTEHRGSVARRMQCVHCKGITEDVETDPFECSHCGLNLFVRDHYSRRLAAFQGVCIDAEDPGNVPEKVELYK